MYMKSTIDLNNHCIYRTINSYHIRCDESIVLLLFMSVMLLSRISWSAIGCVTLHLIDRISSSSSLSANLHPHARTHTRRQAHTHIHTNEHTHAHIHRQTPYVLLQRAVGYRHYLVRCCRKKNIVFKTHNSVHIYNEQFMMIGIMLCLLYRIIFGYNTFTLNEFLIIPA